MQTISTTNNKIPQRLISAPASRNNNTAPIPDGNNFFHKLAPKHQNYIGDLNLSLHQNEMLKFGTTKLCRLLSKQSESTSLTLNFRNEVSPNLIKAIFVQLKKFKQLTSLKIELRGGLNPTTLMVLSRGLQNLKYLTALTLTMEHKPINPKVIKHLQKSVASLNQLDTISLTNSWLNLFAQKHFLFNLIQKLPRLPHLHRFTLQPNVCDLDTTDWQYLCKLTKLTHLELQLSDTTAIQQLYLRDWLAQTVNLSRLNLNYNGIINFASERIQSEIFQAIAKLNLKYFKFTNNLNFNNDRVADLWQTLTACTTLTNLDLNFKHSNFDADQALTNFSKLISKLELLQSLSISFQNITQLSDQSLFWLRQSLSNIPKKLTHLKISFKWYNAPPKLYQ